MNHLSNDNIVIILVGPQMGENIGAAARAMKNFGLTKLRIVNPRDGWSNDKALSMAAHASDVIEQAEIYDNLEAAIADLQQLYATTAVARDMNKDYILSKDLAAKHSFDLKTGIMFGRENCGLTNSEISLANKIITIDTAEFSSINIAQAVVIICYELFKKQFESSPLTAKVGNEQIEATQEEIGFFLQHLFSELDKKGFFTVIEKKPRMMQNITNIFKRIDKLSKTEVQTLRGVINSFSRK